MKKQKEPKAEIMAFFVGGAKLHATTTLEKETLDNWIENAMSEGSKFITLDTVNEDQKIDDDSITILFDKMLFYTTFVTNKSGIIVASPSKLQTINGQ